MELCNYPCTCKTRYYEIEAIEIPIVYNKYGDHDPNGLMYVLKKDADRIRKCAMRCFSMEPPQPCGEVKPLVIRANCGEKIVVTFSHSPNSEWFDPQTGKPLESGLFADIYHPAKPAFREYAVFFHDELEDT